MMTGPAKTQMTLLERGHKSCDHVRGRHFLVLCSRGPTAVSASIISRFGLRFVGSRLASSAASGDGALGAGSAAGSPCLQ